MMRHLWQRIFAYSLVLIVISQAAVLLLHYKSAGREEVRLYFAESTRSIAASMESQSLSFAEALTGIFNRKKDRLWLEDEKGKVIAGARPRGAPFHVAKATQQWKTDTFTLWQTDDEDTHFISSMPVSLSEGQYTLYQAFGRPHRPSMWTMFFQGVMVLSLFGIGLAFWMARRVSRPLRNLRDEVMEIAGENLSRRVTETGYDEISDVAVAVNHMADNLAKHIRGMKELVANISHEMRSPLARMQVSLALLEEDLARSHTETPQAAARLALLHEELKHMNDLIGTTLLSSKLDLQDPPTMTETVAFSELCSEAARRHEPVFQQRQLRFIPDIEKNIFLLGDESLLKNLVSNLLDNAAKYCDDGGETTMRLSLHAEYAELSVANDHAPLPQEVLDHLFEPFYRGGIATGSGVGLGLSLVSKIAALHGGKAKAVNTDSGICFRVGIPATLLDDAAL